MKTANKPFVQRAKVGVAGSFINQMMSNNNSIPEVGKGATYLQYTDRDAYEVVEVSEDKMTVKLEALDARYDDKKYPNGNPPMGHQDWILEPTGRFVTVVWRNNAWKVKSKIVTFTKEFAAKHPGVAALATVLTEEQRDLIYKNDIRPQTVVEGITKEKFEYHKMNLLFGRKDYYYDWSF